MNDTVDRENDTPDERVSSEELTQAFVDARQHILNETDPRDDLIGGLQDSVDELEGQLAEAEAARPVVMAPSDFVTELRALAATIRTCQRTGHPDAPKHIEALLTRLEQ